MGSGLADASVFVLFITADTNVIISGLNFSGNPRHVLEMAENGAIHLAVSDAILDEVERVLRREKFGWPDEEIDKAIRQITRFAEHVEPKQRIDAVKEDPTDNRILECATLSSLSVVAVRALAEFHGVDERMLRCGAKETNFGNGSEKGDLSVQGDVDRHCPPIWRRFQVPAGFSLAQLHRALQVALGWENYHLYTFRIGGKKYGPTDVDDDDDLGLIDAKRVRLSGVLRNVGATVTYVYDYGDDWEHELLLEAILMPDPEAIYPRCIAGERCCPPEDVGGVGGYTRYVVAMADPNHGQYEETMMWRGPFDAEDFSIEKVNRELDKKFRPKNKPSVPRLAIGTSKPS